MHQSVGRLTSLLVVDEGQILPLMLSVKPQAECYMRSLFLVHVWGNLRQPVRLNGHNVLHLIPAIAALLNLEEEHPLWLCSP